MKHGCKALLAATLAITSAVAGAQPYPQKPIRIIVTFAAGGPTDGIARVLAQDMSATRSAGAE